MAHYILHIFEKFVGALTSLCHVDNFHSKVSNLSFSFGWCQSKKSIIKRKTKPPPLSPPKIIIVTLCPQCIQIRIGTCTLRKGVLTHAKQFWERNFLASNETAQYAPRMAHLFSFGGTGGRLVWYSVFLDFGVPN